MAAKKMVKCMVCQQTFDRNSVPCVQVGRRYKHEKCPTGWQNSLTDEDKEMIDFHRLRDYIQEILKDKAKWEVISVQIQNYKEESHYTYQGMLGTLIYLYKYRNTSTEDTIGIGLIPYYYDEAKKYYMERHRINMENTSKNLLPQQPKEVTIKDADISRNKRFKSFWKDDD